MLMTVKCSPALKAIHIVKCRLCVSQRKTVCFKQELSWAWICKHFKEPRNKFPAWRAGTTTLFDVPTGPPGYKGGGFDSLELIPGLFRRLKIRALRVCLGCMGVGGGRGRETTVIQHQIYPVLNIWATIGPKKDLTSLVVRPYVGRPII